MATITAPKGTADILPSQSHKWHYVENIIRDTCRLYGFSEIRTPVFEHTEVFVRGVGDTTDVVTKEMYTFEDKGGRSITLRPEGTAGTVRAVLQKNAVPLSFDMAAPVRVVVLVGVAPMPVVSVEVLVPCIESLYLAFARLAEPPADGLADLYSVLLAHVQIRAAAQSYRTGA